MDWSSSYVLDEDLGVRVRRDRAVAYEYSDGAVAEAYILESIQACDDVSSGSDELVRRIRDWPSEYHFSASRATVLAPFDLRGLRVLEVGSGCGALTRALGEGGARVVALEGSLERARITAARCRGLSNVEVVCDDFRDFLPPSAFDVVLLVGVLEYAPCYFAGDDPIGGALTKARDCLAEQGAAIVAIENQLGLKYFAGATEDHHGRAFFGVEDRYAETPEGPRTLGRGELRRRLTTAGLAAQTWYYPFPDYKLPRLILTEQGLDDPRLPAAQLVAGLRSRDYAWPHPEIFAEDAAWEVAGRNGLIADLANSFLVVASASTESQQLEPPGWLAELRTTDRLRPFRTVTRFVPGADGLRVTKVRQEESAAPAGHLIRLVLPEDSPLLPGAPLETRLRGLLRASDTDAAALAGVLLPWADLLRTESGESGVLPGHLLDLLPRNLMEPPERPLRASDPAGLRPFDLEWVYVPELEYEHVLFRGLAPLLLGGARGHTRLGDDRMTEDVLRDVAARLGATMTPDRISALAEREAAIQSAVFGMDEQDTHESIVARLREPFDQGSPLDAAVGLRDARIHDLMLIVAERDERISEQDERVADLEHLVADGESARALQAATIASLSEQMKSVEDSASWKLTAPLRRLRRHL